jgi:surface protein
MMFKDATKFKQNLGTWDVHNVQDMAFMFEKASTLNQSLCSWAINIRPH